MWHSIGWIILAVFTGAMIGCADTRTTSRTDAGSDGGSRPLFGGLGDPCEISFDCESELVCRSFVCSEPASEGELCGGPTECGTELDCVDGVCRSVGAAGEPCTSFGGCDAGLMCSGGTCYATTTARFCHCLVSATFGDPIYMNLDVGGTVLGPTVTRECSPCTTVPAGPAIDVTLLYEDGREFRSGTMQIDPAWGPIVLFGSTTDVSAYPYTCEESVPCM